MVSSADMIDFGSRPVISPRTRPTPCYSSMVHQFDRPGATSRSLKRVSAAARVGGWPAGGRQRPAPRVREVQGLLATVTAGLLAHQVALRLEATTMAVVAWRDPCACAAEPGLRDLRVVRDQPRRGHLLLREVQVREGLGEVAVDGAVSQANTQSPTILRFSQCLHHRPRAGSSDGDGFFFGIGLPGVDLLV